MYVLGRKSKERLGTVVGDMQRVVERAIQITEVDFSVLEGERSAARQLELWKAGATKLNGIQKGKTVGGITGTGIGNHQTCEAVDLGAYVGGSIRWDFGLYYKIAAAMQIAAKQEGVRIRWGGIWDRCLNDLIFDIESEMADYVQRRKSIGRKAFLDGPHFELM